MLPGIIVSGKEKKKKKVLANNNNKCFFLSRNIIFVLIEIRKGEGCKPKTISIKPK